MILALTMASGLFVATRAAQKGSENKGRFYFRETCKECHTKGAVGSEVTPLNKTMEQWRAYFAKGTTIMAKSRCQSICRPTSCSMLRHF